MGRVPDLSRLLGTGAVLAVLLAGGCGSSEAPPAAPSATTSTAAPQSPAPPDTTVVPGSAPGTIRTSGSSPSSSATTITATSTSAATGNGLRGRTIVVDPGHDGANGAHPEAINRLVDIGNARKECDTTGTATDAGYRESAYTFDVARRLQAVLEARGATVVLTRTSDDGVGPCIDERARIGNQARADAAISIHADGGPATGTGFHVIRPAPMGGPVDAVVEPSTRLAQAIRTAFAAGTATAPATYLSTQDGIVARSDLGGLNLSTVPKVFIETGNMRNAADAARLGDPAFREREAEALADGLQRFLSGG